MYRLKLKIKKKFVPGGRTVPILKNYPVVLQHHVHETGRERQEQHEQQGMDEIQGGVPGMVRGNGNRTPTAVEPDTTRRVGVGRHAPTENHDGIEGADEEELLPATQLLEEAVKHRDTLMYPRVIQTWEFIRRYMSESDKLNWSTEPACRASMRKQQRRTVRSGRRYGRPTAGQP